MSDRTYELKIERVFDASPELVFDTLVDPDAQEELHNGQVPGWGLVKSEMDLRVGGTWDIVFGPEDGKGEPDRLHSVFTEIDRAASPGVRLLHTSVSGGARSTPR